MTHDKKFFSSSMKDEVYNPFRASLPIWCGKFYTFKMKSRKRNIVNSGLLIVFLSLITFSILVSCNIPSEPVLIPPTQTSQPMLNLPTQTAKPVKIMLPIILFAPTLTEMNTDLAPVIATELPLTEAAAPLPSQTIVILEEPEAENCANGCTDHKEGCDIKGNISFTTGEKIYHVPGGAFYEDTVINSENGERWFCTEAEVIANRWRKSKR
jgi:hypothetical protein